MKLFEAPAEKVGFFASAVLLILAVMAIQVGDNPRLLAGGKRYSFYTDDAAGLVRGSQVKMAGIPVGIISDILYENGRAKVVVQVPSKYSVYGSAKVKIRTQGILGDKYVEIHPGDPADGLLEDSDTIRIVVDTGSLDKLAGQLSEVAESIKVVAKNLSEAVSDDGTDRHLLGRIIKNVEKLTFDISEITAQNKKEINEIVLNLRQITRTLNEVISDPSPSGIRKKIDLALDRLNNSLKNIEDITGKINRGEGTLGKLISDENTSDIIDNTLEGIDTVFGGVPTIQTSLVFQSLYLSDIGGARTGVGVRLDPGPDRHYFLGVVDDPSAIVEITESTVTSNGQVTENKEVKRFYSRTRFSLWFGKSFYDLTIRAGLIESSAGVGFDYSLLNDRFFITAEMLEFKNLNFRAHVQARLWRGLYLVAGGQDLFGLARKQSSYLGVNLMLTNEDLLLLVTRMPTP